MEGIKTETGQQTVNTSIIELKQSGSGESSSPGHVSSHVSAANTWNLPDLLVGLDGITTRSSSDSDSPPLPPSHQHNIPCISLPSLPNLDNSLGQHSSTVSSQSYYFEPSRLPSLSVSGSGQVCHNTDSLLEGLGILSPVTSIKTEMVTCPSPVSHGQYSLVDTRVDMVDNRVDSPITMDLSQLVSQHNIPANFELSLSPVATKLEPGHNIAGSGSLCSQLTPGTPLPLDLIAQHCTLLPPELVSITPVLPPVSAISPTTYISHHQDLANNNIQDMEPIINPVNIKEVRI